LVIPEYTVDEPSMILGHFNGFKTSNNNSCYQNKIRPT